MLLHEILRESASRFDADKAFAAAIYDLLAVTEKLSFDTVKTRVSKLLNGKPDGRDFFFEAAQPHRLHVLAAVAQQPADELQRLADQLVLVVDPRHPPDIVAFLVDRSQHATESFAVVVPEQAADVRVSVRDEAKRHRKAVAVLSHLQDAPFFEGAGVAVTRLLKVPRGITVAGHEALYPLPPPPPPQLFDAAGRVRVPLDHAKDLSALEHVIPNFRLTINELHQGFSRTVDLDGAVTWFRSTLHYRQQDAIEYDTGPRPGDFPQPRAERTRIWEHERRVFAVGPQAEAFAAFLAPHHVVVSPTWETCLGDFAPLMADPWHAAQVSADMEDPRVAALVGAAIAAGVWRTEGRQTMDGVAHVLAWLRQEATTAIIATTKCEDYKTSFAPFHAAWATISSQLEPATGPARIGDAAQDEAVRARIAALVEHGAEPSAFGVTVLRALQRGIDGPLVILTRGDEMPHVVIDLGGGHLLEVRTVALQGPTKLLQRLETSHRRPERLWGGDVLVQLEFSTQVVLEGAEPPRLSRRHAEAERAAKIANDD